MEANLGEVLHEAAREGLLYSAHDVGHGGLELGIARLQAVLALHEHGLTGRVGEAGGVGQLLPAVPGLATPGFDTAALHGEVTVVNVFASWCVPCSGGSPAAGFLNR